MPVARSISLLLAITLASGCAHRIGDFTVASTKNINVKDGTHTINHGKRLTGRDTIHVITFIPTGAYPDMKEAMDNAIEKSPGAVALSNVTIKRGQWYIPFIYGQDYYEVEGNPVYEITR